MKIYIAGPMRGYEKFNAPAFFAAEGRLWAWGYDPVNPAQMDIDCGLNLDSISDTNSLPDSLTLKDIIKRDLDAIQSCEAIYMLSSWEDSTGARAERAVAEWLGLSIYCEGTCEPPGIPRPIMATLNSVPDYIINSRDKLSPKERKALPLATGCLDYFPDALLAVSELSRVGNDQHNPGKPLHWDRTKSTDHDDCLLRHFLDRDHADTDGVLHRTKVAWRALAGLQTYLENKHE